MAFRLVLDTGIEGMGTGDDRQSLTVRAAKQGDERLTQELALQIPERDVDGAERERRDASLIAVPPGVSLDAPPQFRVFQWALVQEQRGQALDQRFGGACRFRPL